MRLTATAIGGLFIVGSMQLPDVAGDCIDRRPPPSERNFVSPAVDSAIESIASNMTDSELACIFRNSLPNTLDTTVTFPGGTTCADADLPFVITGDITAMWLRDSMNQVSLPHQHACEVFAWFVFRFIDIQY